MSSPKSRIYLKKPKQVARTASSLEAYVSSGKEEERCLDQSAKLFGIKPCCFCSVIVGNVLSFLGFLSLLILKLTGVIPNLGFASWMFVSLPFQIVIVPVTSACFGIRMLVWYCNDKKISESKKIPCLFLGISIVLFIIGSIMQPVIGSIVGDRGPMTLLKDFVLGIFITLGAAFLPWILSLVFCDSCDCTLKKTSA